MLGIDLGCLPLLAPDTSLARLGMAANVIVVIMLCHNVAFCCLGGLFPVWFGLVVHPVPLHRALLSHHLLGLDGLDGCVCGCVKGWIVCVVGWGCV